MRLGVLTENTKAIVVVVVVSSITIIIIIGFAVVFTVTYSTNL